MHQTSSQHTCLYINVLLRGQKHSLERIRFLIICIYDAARHYVNFCLSHLNMHMYKEPLCNIHQTLKYITKISDRTSVRTMSENCEKCRSMSPEDQGRTQRCSVYCHRGGKKPQNINIQEAEVRGFGDFPFLKIPKPINQS